MAWVTWYLPTLPIRHFTIFDPVAGVLPNFWASCGLAGSVMIRRERPMMFSLPMQGGTPALAMPFLAQGGSFFPLEARDCPKKRGHGPGRAGGSRKQMGLAAKSVDRTGGGAHIVCAICGCSIAREDDRMEVQGSHTHGFANPHGIYYDIGCFVSAPGCAFSSDASGEFTWFAGHRWRLGSCRGCGTHLGWLFESRSGKFVGLILAALRVERDGEQPS